jgi:predicted DsbA family dithiol-disulfide isomerase
MKSRFLIVLLLLGPFIATSQGSSTINKKPITIKEKMKVEIWSDVMCPFCYIGKRKFEAALSEFEHRENVEVVWKSFQLNPSLKTDASKNIYQYLAENKGWTLEYAKNTTKYVTDMAKGAGLNYNFDNIVAANTFDAQRLMVFAKKQGKGDAAEERLFKAYFTEGKNVADHEVLAQLGADIGLNASEIKDMLAGDRFSDEVKNELQEAEQIGVTGVPFFVFDRKYAVSGAQDPKHFLSVLKKVWEEKPAKDKMEYKDGAVCNPEGECE